MIKFRRGRTSSWRSSKTKLAAGQPGYDKDKHKIKIGDGEKLWTDLPYVSGLFTEEVLDSEANAKTKKSNDTENVTLITYGTEAPDENTVGQIYLRQIDDPEVDYVIETGTKDGWTYQKWKSGIAKCWRNYSFTTTVQEHLELFCRSTTTSSLSYPVDFVYIPTETTTVQSSGGQVLLANSSANTAKTSGTYAIISLVGEIAAANYTISIQVEGFWREP
jgi:hypothetical protein